ncbi:hypothetical protein [Natrialba chahannaoensis]|nr:hypothetical protein [Natrialba chahannaoensis]
MMRAKIDRRDILQSTVLVGVSNIAGVGLSAAEKDIETEELGTIHYSEMGITFDCDLIPNTVACYGPSYEFTENYEEMIVPMASKEDVRVVKKSDEVVNFRNLLELPTSDTRRKTRSVPLALNKQKRSCVALC